MEFRHEPGRIWMESAKGELLAGVLFPVVESGIVEITHTFVDDSLRGQGVAAALLMEAAEELRRSHNRAKLSCSYAVAWSRRHPEYADLIV